MYNAPRTLLTLALERDESTTTQVLPILSVTELIEVPVPDNAPAVTTANKRLPEVLGIAVEALQEEEAAPTPEYALMGVGRLNYRIPLMVMYDSHQLINLIL